MRSLPSLTVLALALRAAAAPEEAADAGVEAAAAAPEPAPAADAPALPDGRYGCMLLGTGLNYFPTYTASVLGTIVLDGGAYRAPGYKGGGKVAREGARLRFSGGPFDGWVAAIDKNSSGPFFRFREKDHQEPGEKTLIGDHLCFLQKK